MMKNATIASLVAAVALVFSTWSVSHHRHQLADTVEKKSASSRLSMQFGQGASRAYRWSLTTVVSPSAQSGGASHETIYQGQLNIRVLESVPHAIMAIQASGIEVRVVGVPNPKLAKVLETPFVVAVDSRGQFGESRFMPNLAQGDRGVLDGAVRSLQFVLPKYQAEHWTEIERDQNGDFLASYVELPEAGTITKVKQRYVSTRQPGLSIRIASSASRAQIDSAGPWIASAEGREQLVLEAQGKILATIDARFALEALPEAPGSELALWHNDLGWARLVGLDAPSSQPRSAWIETGQEQQRTRFIQGGVTIKSLLAALHSHSTQDAAFAHEFATYLQLFPDEARGLSGRAVSLKESEAGLLFNILEMAGTQQAQAALAEVAENKFGSPTLRIRAFAAIAGIEQPTAGLIARVIASYSSLRTRNSPTGLASSSLLALGSLAAIAPNDLRATAVDRLLGWLKVASNPEEQSLCLAALGNARVRPPADTIDRYLKAKSPQVRAAAVALVGAIQDEGATDQLSQAIAGESAANVRAAALGALEHQSPSERANNIIAQALSAGTEPQAELRARMASYLGRHMREFPNNRRVLDELLRQESSRQVIVAILNTLAR